MATKKQSVVQILRNWLGSHWGVALLLAVVTVAVLSPVLIFQTTTLFVNQDNVDQFFAWYQKLATAIHSGYLPLWNANMYSGWEFAAELQPGILYPLNWLWVGLFGSINGISEYALNWLVAFHFWLAAFGGYLLLRQFAAERWAAMLAGLVFAFSGVVASRSVAQTVIFFGLAIIPYVLLFFVKYHLSQRKLWLVASGATLGSLFIVGHIQPFFHALLLLLIFEVVYVFKKRQKWPAFWPVISKSIRNFLIIAVSAVVIMLPQIAVSGYYLTHAYRTQVGGLMGPDQKIGYGEFAKPYNIDMHEFINMVDPVTYQMRDGNNIFIGLAPLVVILLAAFVARKQIKATELWRKYSGFVVTTLVFSAVAMLGYVTWLAVVLYELPFVYQVRQLGRYSIMFDLALMVVLAVALMVMAKVTLTKKQKVIIGCMGAFLLLNGGYIFALHNFIFSVHFAMDLALAGLAGLAIALTIKFRKLLLATTMLLTLFANAVWFLPVMKPESITPAKYSLPAGLVAILESTNGKYRVDGGSDLPVNVGSVYDVQTTWGYSATVFGPYYEFTNTSKLPIEFVRDLLGAKLLATREPAADAHVVYLDSGKFALVERPTALPKMFVSAKAGSTDRNDYTGLAVTTESYGDMYQRYSVTLDTDKRVILSELYYPGWQAWVDGKQVTIEPYQIEGKDLFKSLAMSQGTHIVELRYKAYGLF